MGTLIFIIMWGWIFFCFYDSFFSKKALARTARRKKIERRRKERRCETIQLCEKVLKPGYPQRPERNK